MPREFERRFLLNSHPPGDPAYEVLIRQVYWSLGAGWFLRLRRQGTDSEPDDILTVKGPRFGVERVELEFPLTPRTTSGEFDEAAIEAVLGLFRAGAPHRIVKLRRGYLIDDRTWDVDEFLFDNDGLVIAEFQDPVLENVRDLEVPSWVGREVTNEPRYYNENLALRPSSTWDT